LVSDPEVFNVDIESAMPQEALRHLMNEHGLKQAELSAEIGSQGVVSEVLNGKRQLNARQARALAARFNVSAAFFVTRFGMAFCQ
jgi:HTH-type transcriptional regulator / antitoxin HigA